MRTRLGAVWNVNPLVRLVVALTIVIVGIVVGGILGNQMAGLVAATFILYLIGWAWSRQPRGADNEGD